VSPVKYELAFYIPENRILHSHCREKLKSYIGIRIVAIFSDIAVCQEIATFIAVALGASKPTQI
jgi:hypothetical protein